MKKLLLLSCFLFAVFAEAQTPMYFNTNVAAGNNAFPFATATSRKVQWRILANSLGAVTPGNNITKVYFHTGSATAGTYPLLNISLKQGPGQFSGGGLYETGMTVVYSGTNVAVTPTLGGWMGFTLQTPFLYNPNLPLFVEVEHNGTSGAGPTVYQNSPVGPGSGRQYGNYPNTSYTGADATVVNFGVDVIPATPCTAAPPANSVIPSSFTTCPGLSNPILNVAASYSFGGITYQWQSSTVSPVGPYAPIPNMTLAAAPLPTLGVTTWYQLVATCTNISTNNTTTLTGTEIFVAGQTSSVVPYYEDFELVQMDNRLPNCSWSASSLGNMNQSSVGSGSGNRLPRSGSKFASFNNGTSSGTSYYYTNPIQMNPGITYSAALWYATEYFGYSNWTNLSIFVGTSQTPTGLVQIASIGPAISGPYKLLDGTFTVPSSGQYYIAIKAISTAGGAQYLTWDDLSVTIPCTPLSGNSPTVIMSASSNTICQGTQINLNATGGDAYLWYDGSTTSTLVASPMTTTILTVSGTNTVTNCTTTISELIVVDPSPVIIAVSDKYLLCPGQTAFLTAFGADSYNWQGNPPGNIVAVKPMTTTSYTVQGSNNFGCSTEAVVTLTVMPTPTVTATSLSNNESCIDDLVTLSAGGGNSYVWYSSTSANLLQGQQINIMLQQPTTFTVVGQAPNTCTSMATVNQNVVSCVGLEALQAGSNQITMFPNPTSGILQLELNDSGEKTIEITDISGRVVFSHHTSGTSLKLDISTLAAGVYNATVKSENSTYSSRLIKN